MTRRHRKNPPGLWLMTDERVDEARLLAAVARLPRGRAGIVFRHYATPARERRALYDKVASLARRRRLILMLGGSARDAVAWRADGWHGRDHRRGAWHLLYSRGVHDARELVAAQRSNAMMIFLSPLFATQSHPGAVALGRVRFAALAISATMPVMALGGVSGRHRHRLSGIGAAGWGAIDALTA
ncbi:thiamine phosphate synthase [Sphingobium sp. AN641]|uniref:thiamine phosphate synthase n=1 Tax=Sphingobium sp. AN641 TaxID=3133443 RepID=UPI0030C3EFC6